ncbi:MAG: tetratricopeptide repeat protein [Chloroflexi bacterium]|nr:MAG: tetratricopeptide repeat protein [Chloroflexota bacterium]
MTTMRLVSQPEPGFVQAINNGLAFWHKNSLEIHDSASLIKLNADVDNLIRILDFALKLPGCWQPTAELIAQVFILPDRLGYWRLWQEILAAVIANSPKPDSELTLLLQCQYGKLKRSIGHFTNAVMIHQRALSHAQQLPNKDLAAKINQELAWDFYFANNLHDAIQEAEKALRIYRLNEVDVPVVHVDILRVLGICETRHGNWGKAENYLQMAFSLAKHLEDVIVPARTLIDLSILYRRMGAYEKGLDCDNQAKKLLVDTIFDDDFANVLLNMGSIYFDMGNFEAAKEAFEQGYNEYGGKSSDFNKKVHFINNLGNVYWKQGYLSKAEAFLRDALALRPKIGDEVG